MSGPNRQSPPIITEQPFLRTEPIIQLGMLRLAVAGGGSADVFLS